MSQNYESISIPLTDGFYSEIKEISETELTRAQFVHNFGLVLAQTRERILGCKYKKTESAEVAEIYYKGGNIQEVNIQCDSWEAIIKDIMKTVLE